MTRQEIQSELATIGLRLHGLTRGGVARTKETEVELARLRGRKAELESAWATAPMASALEPQQQRRITEIRSELAAIDAQVARMQERSTPLILSEQQREGQQLESYAARARALQGELAMLEAMPASPAAAPPPAHQPPPGPSAFPRVATGSPLSTIQHLLQQEEQAVAGVANEAGVRDGRYGAARPEIFRRLGMPVPDDQRTAGLAGVPVYGRPGGNGLSSPAVQAQLLARGKKLA